MKLPAYSERIRRTAAVVAKAHVFVIRSSGGRVGRRWRGGEVVLLCTIGRHSGRRRTTPLVCIRDGDDVVVVASCGGSDRTPDWWLNLQARPEAELQFDGRMRPVVTRDLSGVERARLAERFARAFPCFEEYRSRTERTIPVVALRERHAADQQRSA